MPKTEVEIRKGKVTTSDGDELEVDLRITRTFHEDGRIDVNIGVPALGVRDITQNQEAR